MWGSTRGAFPLIWRRRRINDAVWGHAPDYPWQHLQKGVWEGFGWGKALATASWLGVNGPVLLDKEV